jgi:hypothetical protein
VVAAQAGPIVERREGEVEKAEARAAADEELRRRGENGERAVEIHFHRGVGQLQGSSDADCVERDCPWVDYDLDGFKEEELLC